MDAGEIETGRSTLSLVSFVSDNCEIESLGSNDTFDPTISCSCETLDHSGVPSKPMSRLEKDATPVTDHVVSFTVTISMAFFVMEEALKTKKKSRRSTAPAGHSQRSRERSRSKSHPHSANFVSRKKSIGRRATHSGHSRGHAGSINAKTRKKTTLESVLLKHQQSHVLSHPVRVELKILPSKKSTGVVVTVHPTHAVILWDDDCVPMNVMCWRDGEINWLSWSHKDTIEVTDSLLTLLYDHKVEMFLTPAKGSTQRRSTPSPWDFYPCNHMKEQAEAIEKTVLQQFQCYSHHTNDFRPLPRTFRLRPDSNSSPMSSKRATSRGSTPSKKHAKKKETVTHQEKKPQASIQMAMFFAGTKSLTARLESTNLNVEDAFITMTLDGPLLSPRQADLLKPMAIKIKAAKDLPSPPASLKCEPVYCSYKIPTYHTYRTEALPQAKNVRWVGDLNMVLLGRMADDNLREFLQGPPLKIEVHDKDYNEEIVQKPALFGDKPEDAFLSNTRRYMAIKKPLLNWIPYGVAKLDLSELLWGLCFLCVEIGIQAAPLPHRSKENEYESPIGEAKSVSLSGGDFDHLSVQSDNYTESGSTLRVELTLAAPLFRHEKPKMKPTTCPIGRIIIIFDNTVEGVSCLLQEIVTVNSKGLQMGDLSDDVAASILSVSKLNPLTNENRAVDVVTGFHILDERRHIFILEGHHERGIKVIRENMQHKDLKDMTILYNTSFSFSKRLYDTLDIDLFRCRLREPLDAILAQNKLYISHAVVRPCFRALMKLNRILSANTMAEVVKGDAFPTVEEIVFLTLEVGLPITTRQLLSKYLPPRSSEAPDKRRMVKTRSVGSSEISRSQSLSRRKPQESHQSLDCSSFLDYLVNEAVKTETNHDFVGRNKDRVRRMSDQTRLSQEPLRPKLISAPDTAPYNYSSQRRNSGEKAKRMVEAIMQKDPGTRYTYSQNYASRTVSPFGGEDLKRIEQEKSRAHWLTKEGWIYPGMRTALEDNIHPLHPPVCCDKHKNVKEKWRENLMHVNVLQPPADREPFPWERREQDFKVYEKPQLYFADLKAGLVCGSWKEEKEDLDRDEQRRHDTWESKLVVDNARMDFHRLLPATEMTARGPRANNVLDKRQGLRKSSRVKFGIRFPYLDGRRSSQEM